jgi:hypothetical protein
MASPIEQIEESSPPSAGQRVSLGAQIASFWRENGYWYLTSAIVHAIGFVIFALLAAFLPSAFNYTMGEGKLGRAPSFDAADPLGDANIPESFAAGDSPIDPSELGPDTLLEFKTPNVEAKNYTDDPEFVEGGGGRATDRQTLNLGGQDGFPVEGFQGIGGPGGVGTTDGTGDGNFVNRGKGKREGLVGTGGTKLTERAVATGLHWLYKHQGPAGNWSIQHSRFCGPQTCGGEGSAKADSGATSLALLCYLGAGQTHKSKGPYKQVVAKGLDWLMKNQKPDGDLTAGATPLMYNQGMGALALCEAYGMTKDPKIGNAATLAIGFIERAQNEGTGGWRYLPGDPGDTSVTGWQLMALKSAQMAGIGVNSQKLENVRRWLASVAKGEHHGLSCYQPYREVTPSMTAVGLLCHQYLGMAKDDPAMLEGSRYLMANLPDANLQRDIYYWYYGTMTMHNLLGRDWDKWNRTTRTILVKSQVKDGGGAGSWDPEHPIIDRWGAHGGRMMTTTLSILTLEVYYRYLPLYKINPLPSGPKSNAILGRNN